MGAGSPFPRGKARPGRDADRSPPSSAEVENESELFLLFPQAPSWRVVGQFFFQTYPVYVIYARLEIRTVIPSAVLSLDKHLSETKASCALKFC
jgi:hypothetical protein